MIEKQRKILHVDMDAFYASVEILDQPKLQKYPVIVGGNPNSRGVVCAANYIAREYGVHSAMPLSRAKNICPKAFFLPVRMSRYKELSMVIQKIFSSYSSLVQPLSLDEAWLDVTENKYNILSATWLAESIKSDIKIATGLNCSIGVSYNKFLAKIASDYNKPNGIYVIPPSQAIKFLSVLDLRKLPGIGKVTEQQLLRLNLKTVGDIQKLSREELYLKLGRLGKSLYEKSRGIDKSEVKLSKKSKSISVESTFSVNTSNINDLKLVLKKLVLRLYQRTHQKGIYGKTINIKIKFYDFEQVTRSFSLEFKSLSQGHLLNVYTDKLTTIIKCEFPNKKVRLMGIGISNLLSTKSVNKNLLDYFKDRQ
ncbi:MAG: DNA polymerase IV [Candidatus Cloacimonadota bacterium]|nr:MAG: DNA polymerase IV [Candidatus Cloacimonadota bacterium]